MRGFNKTPTSQGGRVYIIENAQSYDKSHGLVFYYIIHTAYRATGSQSTFEFPSWVNLSAPSLYCIAGHWANNADTQ